MSQLVATIIKIQNIDNLNIVEFDFCGLTLKMMSLDLNENIQIGKKVKLSIKPTNIAIGKNISGDLSFSNKLVATIKSIENGQLLCSILLNINDIPIIKYLGINITILKRPIKKYLINLIVYRKIDLMPDIK